MNEHILVVDDDPAILHALTARLTHLGHEVVARTDPFAVLGEQESAMPKLAIIDINLPGLSGFELARKLDEHCDEALRGDAEGAGEKLKKIFITASMNPELRRTAEAFEPVGFFEKPYNPQELVELVSECMAQ